MAYVRQLLSPLATAPRSLDELKAALAQPIGLAAADVPETSDLVPIAGDDAVLVEAATVVCGHCNWGTRAR